MVPYRVNGETVEILRVFHASRRPPPAATVVTTIESDTRCVEVRSDSSRHRSGPIKHHALFALALARAFAPISISAIANAGERSDALGAKTSASPA